MELTPERDFWEAREARVNALTAYNLVDDPEIQDALWHEAQAAYHRMRAALSEIRSRQVWCKMRKRGPVVVEMCRAEGSNVWSVYRVEKGGERVCLAQDLPYGKAFEIVRKELKKK